MVSRAVLVALFSIGLTISACDDMGGPPPRVIPGVSVDGVRLGFSTEQVELVLGKPNQVGWSDGAWRTWRMYVYSRGPYSYSLKIYFIDNVIDGSYGPVDKIMMTQGYDGTTREGIGIGTRIDQVRRSWGGPDKSLDLDSGVYQVYCVGDKFFRLYIQNGIVRSMTTGHFVALPEDTLDFCK